MEFERLIRNTNAIQRIPAPTFNEDQRAEHMHNSFKAVGVEVVEMDPAGNVYARLGNGSGKPLVISAHLDNVFSGDTIKPATRRDNRLYGPGVGDNAVALAGLLEIAHDYLSNDSQHPIWLVANVGEEGLGNLLGMQHIIERFGDGALAYIVIEGMALGHIYHQGLPVRRFRIHASTEGGHAWIHAGRPSAIHELIEFGRALLHLRRPRTKTLSVNLGLIEGGTSVNSIASHASMDLDLRSTDASALENWINKMERLLRQAQTDQIQLRVEAIGHRPAGRIEQNHPLVQLAVDSLTEAGVPLAGLEAGSTDASLPLSFGLPAICIGLTNGGDAHSQNEFIELEPLAAGYQALTGLIDRLLYSDGVSDAIG
ncbi:MAG: M20/M25/M40 family metallo-hydrolase [Anaerolineales bacterium]